MITTPQAKLQGESPLGSDPCSGIARATEAARKWSRVNPGWQAICDMESTDHLYMRWEDLPRGAKLAWRNRYGESAKDAYAEETHPCKVANGWVDENGNFTDDVPFGVVGMMVFHSQNASVEARQ